MLTIKLEPFMQSTRMELSPVELFDSLIRQL